METAGGSAELGPYVSRFAQYVLAQDPSAPRAVEAFESGCESAMLFVDVSGFTDLTERLAAGDARGAEAIGAALNDHFARVLGLIAHWGGLVHRFAGDATIGVWPAATHGSIASAARRAARCALAIQERAPVGHTSDHLRQRAVVVAGSVRIVHVGGVDGRWELLAMGEPWTQVRIADRAAAPGDVIASAPCWSLIADDALGTTVDDGCARLTSVEVEPLDRVEPPRPIDLTPFVSRPTLAQVAAGQVEWLAELRRITSVFIGIDTASVTDALPIDRLQAVTVALQAVTSGHEGSVTQFDVDDKGLVVLVTFGTVFAFHEDDPLRALIFAERLHDELRSIDVSARIGITTGTAFAGLVGSSELRQYTVHGDAVNVAARLMQAAEPGRTLCDRATREAARFRLTFEHRGDIAVKGRDAPVAVFRPTGEHRPAPATRHDLIGRRAERVAVESVLAAFADTPSSSVLHIVGEAGIGKSTLLTHVRTRAARAGLDVIDGAGDSVRRAEPYAAWRPVFSTMLGATSGATTDLRSLEALLGGDERVPLLEAVVPLGRPSTPLTATLDPVGRAETTREFLVEVFGRATASRPTVLIVDDVQWLDSASWQLLELLHRRRLPVLVVVVSRDLGDAPLPDEARRLLDDAGVRRVTLGPLGRRDTDRLVGSLLGVTTVAEDLGAGVFERTGGNPLFVEQLVYSLRDRDRLLVVDDGVHFGRSTNRRTVLQLTDGVEGAIASRIDLLPASTQLTLKVCSVLGPSFPEELLRAVHPIGRSDDGIGGDIRRLAEAGLIEFDRSSEGLRLSFKHAAIQDTAYSMLLSEQQRRLHEATARRLDDAGDAVAASVLAHHWCRAGVDTRAVDALELAADEARESYANAEVRDLLLEALRRGEGIADADRRARWSHRLGRALLNLGEVAQAERHLVDAVEILRGAYPGDTAAAMEALPGIVGDHLRIRAGDLVAPADPERALAAAACYEMLAEIHYMTHQLELGMYDTLSGANLAASTGIESPPLATLQANLALAAESGVPWLDRSESYRRDALDCAERLDDPSTTARVLLLVAANEITTARWDDATDHFERSMALCAELGERKNYEFAGAGLGNVLRLQGRFHDADRVARQVLDSGRDRGDFQSQVWGSYGRACSLANLDRYDEQERLLADFALLLDDPRLRGDVSATNVIVLHATRAMVRFGNGDDAGARRDVLGAIESAEQLPRLQNYVTCTIGYLQDAVAATLRRTGTAEALALPARVQRFTRRCARKFPIALPRSLLGAGDVATHQGAHPRARSAWRRAVATAESLGMAFDLAQAHHKLSTCPAVGPDEQRDHEEACARVLGSLGLDRPSAWSI
jgi:class 3 adenylate cyclase/tetratricopeptide (TPR) repeat protein